jgi:hypothetical protein
VKVGQTGSSADGLAPFKPSIGVVQLLSDLTPPLPCSSLIPNSSYFVIFDIERVETVETVERVETYLFAPTVGVPKD